MVLSDVNQLINAHDRYNECLKRVGVIGVPNVISISTAEKLREVAKATGKQVRRSRDSKGGAQLKVVYRGLHVVCRRPDVMIILDELPARPETDSVA